MNLRYQRELTTAIQAVHQAATLCRAVRAGIKPEVLDKKDKSPVTVADFASQAVICRALWEAFPDDPIIAEEDSAELRQTENAVLLDQVVGHVRALRLTGGSQVSREEVCGWINRGGTSEYQERFWTIDPIDGTKGFLRNEQYAVALALVVDGRVEVAALACPNLAFSESGGAASHGVIFTAVRGQGAFALPIVLEKQEHSRRHPIRVSDMEKPEEIRFCESVESGHSAHGDAAAIAARIGIVAPPVRMDSQAKYGVVARGEAEIYLRMPTRADYREKIWDHAAGALIVEEAGGTVTDITGRPLEFDHGRELIANRGVIVTNGRLHARVLEALRKLGLVEDPGETTR
jgi:HAL2 family 3'(2'),5'-bisphosphate nucleotidase